MHALVNNLSRRTDFANLVNFWVDSCNKINESANYNLSHDKTNGLSHDENHMTEKKAADRKHSSHRRHGSNLDLRNNFIAGWHLWPSAVWVCGQI